MEFTKATQPFLFPREDSQTKHYGPTTIFIDFLTLKLSEDKSPRQGRKVVIRLWVNDDLQKALDSKRENCEEAQTITKSMRLVVITSNLS